MDVNPKSCSNVSNLQTECFALGKISPRQLILSMIYESLIKIILQQQKKALLEGYLLLVLDLVSSKDNSPLYIRDIDETSDRGIYFEMSNVKTNIKACHIL